MPWWIEQIQLAIELLEADEDDAALSLLKDMIPVDEDEL